MAFSRPFAYNLGGPISGTTQLGDLAIGTPVTGFTNSPLFWNGPDEDLRYIIARPVPSGNQPNPVAGIPIAKSPSCVVPEIGPPILYAKGLVNAIYIFNINITA